MQSRTRTRKHNDNKKGRIRKFDVEEDKSPLQREFDHLEYHNDIIWEEGRKQRERDDARIRAAYGKDGPKYHKLHGNQQF